MIKKIIGAVSLFITFVVTFAIGVGCIVRGAGDFSWDIVSKYVSMSDVVQINDSPISNLFSFSDHSSMVKSHAEGQIPVPTDSGIIEIEDVPADVTITQSQDEFIHFTFDGNIKQSSVVSSAANLTGEHIPNVEFEYNDGTDVATIQYKRLRTDSKVKLNVNIAIPASFKGNISFKDVAGTVNGDIPLELNNLSVKDTAGKIILSGVSAQRLDISNIAGNVTISGNVGRFEIDNIAGNISVESNVYIADDCKINDVVGVVNITLPTGSLVEIKKKDVMGVVTANSSEKAEHTVTISDVMGKVSINS